MKYDGANLITQIGSRITNTLGKISKSALGSMLTDIADSSVKVKGAQNIEGILTFTNGAKIEAGKTIASKDDISEVFLQKIEEFSTGNLANGAEFTYSPLEATGRTYIDFVEVYSARDNLSGAAIEDTFDIIISQELGPIFNASGQITTVKTSSTSNLQDVDVYDKAGLSVFDKIRIDNQPLLWEGEYNYIQELSAGGINVWTPFLEVYQSDSNVRKAQLLQVKSIVSSGFSLKIKNTSNTSCAYLVRLIYTKIS